MERVKSINSHKVIACDVDETLILWDLSAYPESQRVIVNYCGRDIAVVKHEKNINLFVSLALRDYEMVVWSHTGYDWVESVIKALGLEEHVTLIMTKPRYYIDDKPANSWMERVYRNPKTGKEEEK